MTAERDWESLWSRGIITALVLSGLLVVVGAFFTSAPIDPRDVCWAEARIVAVDVGRERGGGSYSRTTVQTRDGMLRAQWWGTWGKVGDELRVCVEDERRIVPQPPAAKQEIPNCRPRWEPRRD